MGKKLSRFIQILFLFSVTTTAIAYIIYLFDLPVSINLPSFLKPLKKLTSFLTSPPSSFDLLNGFYQPYKDLNNIDSNDSSQNITCGKVPTNELPKLLPSNRKMPYAIRSYINFHRSGLKCLHSNVTSKKKCKVPKMLVWKGQLGLTGGFGDRMITLRLFLVLAMITRRLLFIDWPNQALTPYDLSSALQPIYFDWRYPLNKIRKYKLNHPDLNIISVRFHSDNDVDSFPNPFSLHPDGQDRIFINTTNFEALLSDYSIIYNDFTYLRIDIIHDIINNNAHVNRRYVKGVDGLNYIELQRILTNTLFRPTPVVTNLAKKRSFLYNESYFGIHIRSGIDVNEQKLERFENLNLNATIKKFYHCILRNDIHKTSKNIFIASDSKHIKSLFLQYNADHNYSFQIHTNMRYAWHMDKERSGLFENDSDHCLAFLDIFADAYALSQAHTVYYLRSNFPEVAIGMGDVKYWHKLHNENDLYDGECSLSDLSTVKHPTYGER